MDTHTQPLPVSLRTSNGMTMLYEVRIWLGNDPSRTTELVDIWHSLSTNTSAPTRFRVDEQRKGVSAGITRDYCVTCSRLISSRSDLPWLTHSCIPAPVLISVDFIKLRHSLGSIHESISYIEQLARESPSEAYEAFWKALTLHVVSLFTMALIDIDVIADLRYFHLLHSEWLDVVSSTIDARVAHSVSQNVEIVEDVTFPDRLVPHVYINFHRETEAEDAVEDWYARVMCVAIRGRYGTPTFEATILRLEEQKIDGKKPLSYYCTTCHCPVPHTYWPRHRCRAVVSLTFKLTAIAPGQADSFDVLSWVKNRATRSAAFVELWNVLTRHTVSLLEHNFLALSDMHRLFADELLKEEALSPDMLLALRVHAAEEVYST